MAADAIDILEVKRDTNARPVKKQKITSRRPENIPRELFELIGERAPPVVAQEVQYKSRPKWLHHASPWERANFTNQARKDGLVLKHWVKKKVTGVPPTGPVTPADVEMSGTPHSTSEDKATQAVEEYHYAKFNIKVNVPEYTDEEYGAHLKNIDWTKEETDYLINLASEFDLRWIVIADRYEYKPAETTAKGDEMTVIGPTVPRTMEDMKARYYEVAAKIMTLHHPLSTMSTTEFELHEKMTKFNPRQEKSRKELAEALLNRTADEIKEEEILLGELKRIAMNEEKVDQEREELFARLEAPQSSGSMAVYQTSQGLGQLMQTLLLADKSKKRRSLMGPDGGTSSPADRSANPMSTRDLERGQRTSLPSAGIKKGTPFTPNFRNMSPKEEAKYGITHHDRLTSGVTFRTARVDKLIQAKSTIQSAKIIAALTELGIPPKLVMPTGKVTAEFEKLITGIQQLLEVRKVSEKVEGEIRVLRAQKEERERRERGEESVDGDGVETKEEENENEDEDGAGDVEMEDHDKKDEDAKGTDEEDNDEEENKDEEDADAEGEIEIDAEAEGEDAQDSNDEDGEGDNGNDAEVEAAEIQDSDEDGEGENENDNDAEVDVQSSNDEDQDGEGSDVDDQEAEGSDNNEEDGQAEDDGQDADADADDEPRASITPSVAPSVAQSTRSAGGAGAGGGMKRSGSVISRGSESARSSRGIKRMRK